jgi:hypothetical protein
MQRARAKPRTTAKTIPTPSSLCGKRTARRALRLPGRFASTARALAVLDLEAKLPGVEHRLRLKNVVCALRLRFIGKGTHRAVGLKAGERGEHRDYLRRAR